MQPRFFLSASFFALLLFVRPAVAQDRPEGSVQAEFLNETQVTYDRLISLAEAIPAEQYAWRPAEGVRSVSEVLMHMAGANYFIPGFIGAEVPEGFDFQAFETSQTEKAAVIAEVRRSFEHLRGHVGGLSDADTEKTLNWFGGTNSYRGMLLFMTRHTGEHMGQLIAYARMNGIVPPWSE